MMNQHKIKLVTWEDSSTHFRSLGMTCRGGVSFYPHRLYLPRSGTAHRPFPTVSLVGVRFQPGCSRDGGCNVAHCWNNRCKGARPSRKKLSIQNNCQLSTVNCQLFPKRPQFSAPWFFSGTDAASGSGSPRPWSSCPPGPHSRCCGWFLRCPPE